MALRMTGLASGMDTESIIKELMTAKAAKKTKIEQSKTKLEWKKEVWADLNTKLLSLFRNQVSKMRFQSAAMYGAKKVTSSHEAFASATATSTATNGSYRMQVTSVASAQYLTGSKVTTDRNGEKVTGTTRLTDLDPDLLDKQISIKNGDKEVNFQVRSDATVEDYVSALKEAGLNASYDESQGRFFISGEKSGVENAFSITTTALSSAEVNARKALDDALDFNNLSAEGKAAVNAAFSTLSSLSGTPAEQQEAIDSVVESLTNAGYAKQTADITDAATKVLKAQLYNENEAAANAEARKDYYEEDADGNLTGTIKQTYIDRFGSTYDTLTTEDLDALGNISRDEYIQSSVDKLVDKATKDATNAKVNELMNDEGVKQRLEDLKLDGVSDLSGFTADQISEGGLTTFDGTSVKTRAALEATVTGLVNDYVNVADRSSATDGSALNALGLTDIVVDAAGAHAVGGQPAGMALVSASDSEVTLNGASLTSSTSTITVNGLSVELKGETAVGETITFTVSNDNTATVDAVKDFIKEYNAIVKQMTDLFKAPSAKGYEPLSDEDKEGMSEAQIEKWEKKIKDASLKNDSQLGDLMSSMRMSLQTSVEVDGKKYSLSTFGIVTSAMLSENGMLHLSGDPDDPSFAAEADLLTKALEEDPEVVAKVLSGITQNLYKTMSDKMTGSKVKSAFTFYNDKKMDDDIKLYEEQIKEWTERLETQEDMYYKQFTAMEKTMAQLQSQMNSMAGLFGSS